MPYILSEEQLRIETYPLGEAADTLLGEPGELNYAISRLARGYLKSHDLCYSTLNEIVGAFESAKREFQRRVVDPYEAGKSAIKVRDLYAGIIEEET